MSSKLPPDTKISLYGVAKELGVSQTPVREALSMLEANGLVVRKHFSGYCTAPRLDRRQLDELFEFRLLVEPHAAGKAAERMTPGGFKQLKCIAGTRNTSHEAFADLDRDFHRLIVEQGGNHLIADSLEHLHVHVQIFRSCFRAEITKEGVIEHAAIVKAIRQQNAAAAENAMRRHVQKSYKRLRSFI